MSSHFYAMLSRMKNIYRWGLMRNVKPENLSEHTLETAFVAHSLAVIAKRRLKKNIDPNFVACTALFHDTSEIITGDMPTPVKYYNSDIKSAYKKIEKVAEKRLLDMLPEDLLPDFVPLFEPDCETEKLVKAADKISALIKCIEEENMGNKEFASAKESTLKSIKDLESEEADIFIEEFLNSYSLNLDQLK